MSIAARIAPCLWFDHQAEEAARAYTAIFPNSSVVDVARYGRVGREIHGRAEGSVMTVRFALDGQPFTAINGGPLYTFSEAVSLQVFCDTQAEVDHYWERLGAGADPAAQRCGWLKDRFGLSWQVVPRVLLEMLQGAPSARRERATAAMLAMTTLDIAALRAAFGR